jgi:hypothetical protein
MVRSWASHEILQTRSLLNAANTENRHIRINLLTEFKSKKHHVRTLIESVF